MNSESDNCAWNSTRSSCHLNTLKSMYQQVETSELTYDEVEQTLKFSMNIYFPVLLFFSARILIFAFESLSFVYETGFVPSVLLLVSAFAGTAIYAPGCVRFGQSSGA